MLNQQGIKVRSGGQKRRKALRRHYEEDFDQHQVKRARRRRARLKEQDRKGEYDYHVKTSALQYEGEGLSWWEKISAFAAEKIWAKKEKDPKPNKIKLVPGKENHGRLERSQVNRTPDKRP